MLLTRILKEHEYWLRLTALLYHYRAELYNNILHRSCKLPTDPEKLYEKFTHKRHHIKYYLKRQKITQEQFDLIYPKSGKVDIHKFDIRTFVFVVRHFTKLKPKGGWVLVSRLHRGDKSKGAQLVELESFINENLDSNEPIMFHRFDEDWAELMYILKTLKMKTKTAHGLKKCQLSRTYIPPEYTPAIMKAQFEFIKTNQRMNTLAIRNLDIDDEEDENKGAIFNLQNQNSKIAELLNLLEGFINTKNVSWKAVFEKLSEIDKLLVDLKNDIDFLKEMIHLGHEASNMTEYVSAEADIDTKVRLGMKKLKATYAYAVSKDQNLSESSCCSQPYTEQELLRKHIVQRRSSFNSTLNGRNNHDVYREASVDLDDIFTPNNYVVLRGASGIGKTYTIREIVTEWTHGCIYDEVKFLFVINFTDLQEQSFENLERVLTRFYPHIFEVISYEEIISKPNQMLLIIDGWVHHDGFKYTQINDNEVISALEEVQEGKIEEFDILKCLAKANIPQGELFSQKMIITAHPDDFDTLKKTFGNINFSIVDVVGFSNENIQNYTMNFFSNQKQFLRRLKVKMNENEELRHMASIPSNLYTICYVQRTSNIMNQYKTTTELYLSKLIALIKEWDDDFKPINDATDLIEKPVIVSAIIEASQLSYRDQMSREDSSNNLNEYNIQIFLTSIYLFMMNISPLEMLQDGRLKECLPFVAGLHGIASSTPTSTPTLAQTFVHCLDTVHNKNFIDDLFQTYLRPTKKLKELTFQNDFIWFLHCYYESKGFLTPKLSFKSVKLTFVLHNMLPMDVGHFIHFLNHEWYQLNIEKFDLHTHQPITTKQMEKLAVHLLSTPHVKIDIKMIDGVSETFQNVVDKCQNTKEFRVELKELELSEKSELEHSIFIDFTWLLKFKSLHLNLNTSQVSELMANLKRAIPNAIDANMPIQLSTLKLSIPASYEKLVTAILTLLESFIYINRLEVEITGESESKLPDRQSPYRGHKREKRSMESTDMYTIKHALHNALRDQVVPRNLQKLKVKDHNCNYEFIINNATRQISFVLDDDEECYVDVELFRF